MNLLSITNRNEAIAKEITTPFNGRKVRYLTHEELTCNEIAQILGKATGEEHFSPYLDTTKFNLETQSFQTSLIFDL